MKAIFTGDWHLNSSMPYGVVNDKTGLNSRFEDVLKSAEYLLKYASQNDISVVYFLGDAFKSRLPNSVEQREFARLLMKAHSYGITIYAIAGNHDDTNSTWGATSFDALDLLRVPSFHVIAEPSAQQWPDLYIVRIPWTSNRFLIKDKKKWMRETISNVMTTTPPRAGIRVLILHETIQGSKTEGYQFTSTEEFSDKDLWADRFDYVISGHIHRYQKIEPNIYYTGSVDRVDFGERKDPKGFLVLDSIKKTLDFIKIPTRDFQEIKFSLSSGISTQEIIDEFNFYNIKNKVLKIIIKGHSQDIHKLDSLGLRAAFSQNNLLSGVEFDVIREFEQRISEMKTELSYPEMLRLYLQQKTLTAVQLDDIYHKGLKILGSVV